MIANKKTSFLIAKITHDDAERNKVNKLIETLKRDGHEPELTEGVAFYNVQYMEEAHIED